MILLIWCYKYHLRVYTSSALSAQHTPPKNVSFEEGALVDEERITRYSVFSLALLLNVGNHGWNIARG
jgi:hypothetical protein